MPKAGSTLSVGTEGMDRRWYFDDDPSTADEYRAIEERPMDLAGLGPERAEAFEAALEPDERVLEAIPGMSSTALVLTDTRVHLRNRRGLLQTFTQAAWERSDIESIKSTFGLLEVRVRVSTNGKTSTERHTIMFERNAETHALIARVQRIQRGEPVDVEPSDTPLDPEFESALGSIIQSGESRQFRVPDRSGGGLVVTDRAVYFWDHGFRGSTLRRWPLWAIDRVAPARGTLQITVREDAIVGRPPSTHAILQRDRAATKEYAEALSLYLASLVGLPDSDASVDAELADVTDAWQVPVIVRRYTENPAGHERLRRDTVVLGRHGYAPASHTDEKGKVKTAQLILTGGAGAAVRFASGKGAVREPGVMNATFTKAVHAPATEVDLVARLERLATLRASGALSDAEYEDAKRRLLSGG